jgi:hypothetical protein
LDKVPNFHIPRQIRQVVEDQERVRPLADFRSESAYVLLGEPGSGKTQSFEHEARETGGIFRPVRAIEDLRIEDLAGGILFIDGLDELRAAGGSAHTPLDHVRRQLVRLGKPRFRLSCREADWLGDTDIDALKNVAPSGRIEPLHLEPMNDEEIRTLLAHEGVTDPESFQRVARQHGLDEVLLNPTMLRLLVKAVGSSGDAWPTSRTTIFERACREFARDPSPQHQTAVRGSQPRTDDVVAAAGFVSAVLLFSGDHGVSFFDLPDRASGIVPLPELTESELPLEHSLRTNLFRGPGDGGRSYLHRSVAEYLAGRYIARTVDAESLPLQRILNACTGKDGGVARDLRGMCAWLSAFSEKARLAFIDRDPLGLVLYGDVRAFSTDYKRRIFEALRREAERYAAFRREDWTSTPFGALATRDMLPSLEEYLRPAAKTDAEQAFQDCVIDAVKHGEPMPELKPLLEAIARNGRYWERVRWGAVEGIIRVANPGDDGLLALLEDIRTGKVDDPEDQLLGELLYYLYSRGRIGPRQVFDYLHAPKNDHLIGRYRQFWCPELTTASRPEDLPVLLEELAKRHDAFEDMRGHILRDVVGEVLVRTLEVHGDRASDDELCAWIDAAQDKYGAVRLEHDENKKVSEWISARPDRYKLLASRPIEECRAAPDVAKCLHLKRSRLFDATPPADIVEWYLGKAAAEAQPDMAEEYFTYGVVWLMRGDGQNWPSQASLELLEGWEARYPKFEPWRVRATSPDPYGWQHQEALARKKRKAEEEPRKSERREHYLKHVAKIREGTAPPAVMSELSMVHDGRIIEGRGENPQERLGTFFNGDVSLVEATLTGLPLVPERIDLPSVDEIITTDLAGKRHFIREAAIVGIEMRYEVDRKYAFDLPIATLEKLCAFWLVKGGQDAKWVDALVQAHPEAMVAAIAPYLKQGIQAKKEHLSGIWALQGAEMGAVASRVLPALLEDFPRRATVAQLERGLDPLLKAALRHMSREALGEIVKSRLAIKSVDAPQRVYWLATGLLIDPARYLKPALTSLKGSARRRGHLIEFLGRRLPEGMPSIDSLSDTALASLVEVLGPDVTGDLMSAWYRSDSLHQLVRRAIETLQQRASPEALQRLEHLLTIQALASWASIVRGAIHAVRLAQRAASIPKLSARQASEILSNLEPANAGDLCALTVGHLRDIARKIRRGATNDYNQYWDLTNPPKPRVEEKCRDALLSQLEERLARYRGVGILPAKEGRVANEGRVDVMITHGGAQGIAVPLEAKVDSYYKKAKGKPAETVWTALRTQLIDRYAKHPTANGHGIYLIFWFGGKGMSPSPWGAAPRTAGELEDQLRATLGREDNRIEVVAIDCTLPPAA